MFFRNLHRPENSTIPVEHRCRGLTDEKLIKACVSDGEAEAWEEFIRRFQPRIAGVVSRTATLWTTVTAEPQWRGVQWRSLIQKSRFA